MTRYFRRWALVLLVLPTSYHTQALDVTVTTASGERLSHTVVWATPDDPKVIEHWPTMHYFMDQVNRQFKPHILPIPKGASVSFTNSDTILHHVYSFSPAKTFELKLYKSNEREPVVFNHAGIVNVGCNIHDWMLAYIVVVDTPYFSITDTQGMAQLSLPEGVYTLSIWHERFSRLGEPESQKLTYHGQSQLQVKIKQALAAPLPLFHTDEFDDY
ncbi:MAG TPA: methylamine utilization protein [Cellvibrionaceae bacterium]